MKIKDINIVCCLLVLAISSILVSCADSQDLTTNTIEDQSTISFDVNQNEINTRAQNDINEFQVIGYFDSGITMAVDKKTYLGYEDANSYNPVDIVYNGSSWIYKNKSDMVYWPDEKLNFYATSNFDYSTAKRVSYYSANYFKLKIPHDIRKQKDIMFAASYNVTKNTNNGRVNLTFYHLLNKIWFKAYLADPSYNIEIKDIILHNISDTLYFSPQFARLQGIKSRIFNVPCPPNAERNANISLGISNPIKITAIEKDKATLLNNNPLYIQAGGSYVNSSKKIQTISDLDKSELTYLEIIYRFKINEKQIVPKTGDGYGSTYIPFSTSTTFFENPLNSTRSDGLGSQITIYLKMGGGYDYNLKPVLGGSTIEISTDTMIPEDSQAKPKKF